MAIFKHFQLSRHSIGSGCNTGRESKPRSTQIEQNELSLRTAEDIRRFGVIVGQKGPMDATHDVYLIQR